MHIRFGSRNGCQRWTATVSGDPDESEAIAPANTVSTRFETAPPLAVVDHISHSTSDTTVGTADR